MRKTSVSKFIAAMIMVLTVFMSVACADRIGPGYVGIKVSNAGSSRGINSDAITTGWVFYTPGFSTVYEWPTFVQQVVLTKSASEGNPVNEEITFTNADNMAISADIGFSYHLEGDKVHIFFAKFVSDDMKLFSHGYLRSLIRDKFNEVGGRYKVEAIMGDNGPFIKEVREAVQKEMTPFGVVLDSQFGFIGAPRPPESVVGMINAKVAAVQLAQQKQNELVQAQADAAKMVATSKGEAESLLLTSKAQAESNRILSESLTMNLIELKRIEKWNGAYPLSTGSSSLPILAIK